MTKQRSFKHLVRARMEKTGESYAAARAVLLAATEPTPGTERPPLVTSDENIRRRTGRGWEEWFDLLDDWGAAQRTHRETARWVAEQLGIGPLVWEAQAVTHSYERVRGLRDVGEHADGFAVTAQKTIAVPVERVFDAFVDPLLRERWLPGVKLGERTATRPKVAHFDWAGTGSRLHVTFVDKGDGRSLAAVQHARLADAAEADRMRALWRAALAALKTRLENGAADA
jgi:uncharacterized protein YndB with AHSA1/START domain